MPQKNEQLVASLQTPPGKGGIAVISVTGQGLETALQMIFRPRNGPRNGKTFTLDDVTRLHLGHLLDGEEILDEAVLALTPRGAEINIHGGPMAARRVLRRLANLGATITPSQETAFEPAHPRWCNPAVGRELQAVLPEAPSLPAATALTNQWSAGLSQLAREFLDAEQPPPKAADRLLAAADAFTAMQRLMQPPEVVLAGPPNAGKSTLTNALIARPVSIVHEKAGTTRDWVRERAILNGRCVYLTDTAGLWETDHPIDAESVRRAWERITQADLVLLLCEADPVELPENVRVKTRLLVRTKCDTSPDAAKTPSILSISAHTGEGIPELIEAVLDALHLADINPNAPMAFTPRQQTLLLSAAESLDANDNTWRNILRILLEE